MIKNISIIDITKDTEMKKLIVIAVALSTLAGCATSNGLGTGRGADYIPVVDTGRFTYEEQQQYKADLAQCTSLAREVHNNREELNNNNMIAGAAIGTVLGIALSNGDLGAAAVGGTYGGIVGHESKGKSVESTENITKNCLIGRGYVVLQ